MNPRPPRAGVNVGRANFQRLNDDLAAAGVPRRVRCARPEVHKELGVLNRARRRQLAAVTGARALRLMLAAVRRRRSIALGRAVFVGGKTENPIIPARFRRGKLRARFRRSSR